MKNWIQLEDFFISSNDWPSFNDFSVFQNYSYEDNKPFVMYLLKETPARLVLVVVTNLLLSFCFEWICFV